MKDRDELAGTLRFAFWPCTLFVVYEVKNGNHTHTDLLGSGVKKYVFFFFLHSSSVRLPPQTLCKLQVRENDAAACSMCAAFPGTVLRARQDFRAWMLLISPRKS